MIGTVLLWALIFFVVVFLIFQRKTVWKGLSSFVQFYLAHAATLTFILLAPGVAAAIAVNPASLGKAVIVGSVQFPYLTAPVFLLFCSCLACYWAHFKDGIHDALAWVSIAAVGGSTIVFFTFAYQAFGVLCTGPVCPGSSNVIFDEAGQLLPAISEGSDEGSSAKIARDFTTSLYFSIVTFTTLGYGDMQPIPGMRIIAALEAVLGYLFLGLAVGVFIDFGGRQKVDQTEMKADSALSESADNSRRITTIEQRTTSFFSHFRLKVKAQNNEATPNKK
ncbi:potassium channel family protein [Ruegeria atlantica]|uniref:potassium channel family protein n=1 Tax=Ruegeria atlantica TaxID=81569 RepID=UPI00147B94FE|nr:potassium channel family protein [Ruegeria atlantica]